MTVNINYSYFNTLTILTNWKLFNRP